MHKYFLGTNYNTVSFFFRSSHLFRIWIMFLFRYLHVHDVCKGQKNFVQWSTKVQKFFFSLCKTLPIKAITFYFSDAIEEILKDTKRGATRAEISGSWLPPKKVNSRLVNNTLVQALQSNRRRQMKPKKLKTWKNHHGSENCSWI